MNELNEIAQIYDLGFNVGFFNVKELIQWADSMISKDEKNNEIFIQLSLSEKSHSLHISKLIRNIHRTDILSKIYDILIGLIANDYFKNNLNIEVTTQMLNKLCQYNEQSHWTDSFSNISSKEEMIIFKNDLEVFLNKYRKIGNYWSNKLPTIV